MADKMTGKKPKKVRVQMPAADAGQKGGEGAISKKEAEQRKKK
jgi:hypothetical protein